MPALIVGNLRDFVQRATASPHAVFPLWTATDMGQDKRIWLGQAEALVVVPSQYFDELIR